ncbi:major facilitator superfamily [Nemania sp. FL0916]|nr:major facilitator superfamily [Nemania sp. FL0916]
MTAIAEKAEVSSPLRKSLIVTLVCVVHLCAEAGIGQQLPIMRSVGSRFRLHNADSLSSSVAAYTAALGMFILAAGRLGAIFGHKQIFILGLVLSAIWSVIAGASFYSTQSLFILSRAFQGLGAAFTMPTGLKLLRATRPNGTHKTIVYTLYSTMSPIGLIVGALGASVLDKETWWPWVYWAFSITLVVLGVIGCFVIPSAAQASSLPQGPRAVALELDVAGMLTGIMSLGMFGFAWGQAQVVGWQHAYLWIVLILSVMLMTLFVTIETCYAPKPLIPRSVQTPEILWILIVIGCGWACFGIWIFYGFQFVERLRSASPLLATAYFVPAAVVGCFTAVTTRFILVRFRPHEVFCAAILAMTSGCILICTMPVYQTYWRQLFPSVVVMAWGAYTSVPVAMLIISEAVNKKHGGMAASLVWMAAHYGMALGLGVAATVDRSVMRGVLTASSRLRGYRAAYWTGFGLAGFGLLVCLALALASSRGKVPARRPS